MRGVKIPRCVSVWTSFLLSTLRQLESDKGGYHCYGLSRSSDFRAGVARVSFGSAALVRTFDFPVSRVARTAYRGTGNVKIRDEYLQNSGDASHAASYEQGKAQNH